MKPHLSFIVAFGLGLCIAASLFSLVSIAGGGWNDKEKVEEDGRITPSGAQRQLLRTLKKISDQQALLQEQLQQRSQEFAVQQRTPIALPLDLASLRQNGEFQPIKGEGPNNDHCVIQHPFLEADQIYHLVKLWWSANCSANTTKFKKCTFRSIGRHLLHHAIQQDRTLVTLQIGAMD
ncbi:unnamed protein product [Cylindrotheca closterium]|uniref:Uncharacterized protein n=1 Tax=Cylindrotheca closterium TaxID=2856 RepID=A0AAD2CUL9_9STRA|nr:unnamed protein product [Cylindrotheca closterium]